MSRVSCFSSRSAVAALLVLSAGLPTLAQQPTIKRESAPYVSPISGAEMYTEYCAACHGHTGKGDGPAAPALKMAPTDLTRLSIGNRGTFPAMRFQNILEQGTTPAHGSSDMPVWGRVFRSLDRGNAHLLRIANLRQHVEQLQVK
jgi:mono/diheme cytochrome c family protein